MNIELVTATENPEYACGFAAALCTGSKDYQKSLQTAIGSRHLSVLEHASFMFYVEGISRACMAQFTRHRLAAFAVQGQRYNKLVDEASVVIPESIAADEQAAALYLETKNHALNTYLALLEVCKIKPEDARFILPEGTMCKMVTTMNARELYETFLPLRQCNRAQWEIREVADKMAAILREQAPNIFKNSGPGCVRGLCPEGKLSCGKPRMDLIKESGEWQAF